MVAEPWNPLESTPSVVTVKVPEGRITVSSSLQPEPRGTFRSKVRTIGEFRGDPKTIMTTCTALLKVKYERPPIGEGGLEKYQAT